MSRKNKKQKKVKKSLGGITTNISPENRGIANYTMFDKGRGAQVYSLSNMMNFTGANKQGAPLTVSSDNPYFALTPQERNMIYQLCSPVLGIVSSRQNRIAGLNFEITADLDYEERTAEKLKEYYSIVKEFEGMTELKYMVMSGKLRGDLLRALPTLRPDLNNFNTALLRWKKGLQRVHQDEADELKEWLLSPNPIEKWIDFVKVWVYDILIHGADAIYKSFVDGKLNNIQHIAGGTVIPARTPFVDAKEAYIQVIDQSYQVFFEDEIVFSQYLPVSWRSYGMIPLEALINKVSETLLFDRKMADWADGTKPPEKGVIVTNNAVFGASATDPDFNLPLDSAEQKRIEEKLNNPIKNGIITFNGNNVEVIDLSKENTMDFQNTRQKDIREEVALVFNMSNMEVNLTGAGDTSGRSTSETQMEIEQGKGIAPLIKLIEQKINDEILPYRKRPGFTFKFQTQDSEEKQIDLLTKKVKSGLYSVNQIRVEDLNEMPIEGEEFDKPQGAKGNDQFNPFFTQNVGEG